MGFVPDYRDGVSADSHRLPYRPYLAGRPDIDDPATVPDGAHKINRSGPHILAEVSPFPLFRRRTSLDRALKSFIVIPSHCVSGRTERLEKSRGQPS